MATTEPKSALDGLRSRPESVLTTSTCYAIDLGPSILWVLPWSSHDGAESLCGYVDEKGGDVTSTDIPIDTARFLVSNGTVSELPAHHSPAWTLPLEELPSKPVDIETVLEEFTA